MKKLLVIVVLGLFMYINNLHAKEMPIIECSIIHDGNVVASKVVDLNRSGASIEGDDRDIGCCLVVKITDSEIFWTSHTYGLLNLGLGMSREANKIFHTANRKTGHYSARVVPKSAQGLKEEEAVMFYGKCKAASLDKKF